MMIGLPWARLSTKNGPAWTNSAAVESISAGLARSNRCAASLHQLSNTRSSMKQGTSAVTSGTLPVVQNSARKSSSTARSSAGVSMTSTTGLRQAGSEEMRHRGAVLVPQIGKNPRRRQRRGVRGDPGVRPHQRFELRENLPLQCEVFGRGLDRPIGVARDRVIGRGMNVGADLFGFARAHLAARDGFFRVVGEALHGAVERRLRNIQQIKFQIGQGGFQVIADVGADGAGADHHHAARQRARRFSQQRILQAHERATTASGPAMTCASRSFAMAPKS